MKNFFAIRGATVADVPALAQLQVTTFIYAFPDHSQPPAVSTRQWQWAEQKIPDLLVNYESIHLCKF